MKHGCNGIAKAFISVLLIFLVSACQANSQAKPDAQPDPDSQPYFDPQFHYDDAKLNRDIEARAAEQGITDKAEIQMHKLLAIGMKIGMEAFTISKISEPCKSDFARFCPKQNYSNAIQCINRNRNLASQLCQTTIQKHYELYPLQRALLGKGVSISKGS